MRFLHGLAVINQYSITHQAIHPSRGKIELIGRPLLEFEFACRGSARFARWLFTVFSLRFVGIDDSHVIDRLTPDRVAQYLDSNFRHGHKTRFALRTAGPSNPWHS